MKRRIIAISLCVLLALAAVLSAACTGKNDDKPTPAPATDEPTAEPTAVVTEAPTEAPTGIVFVNELETTVDSLYISPVTSEEWGEAVAELIPSGESIKLDFADFNGEPGYVYDVGAVDENGLNYDVWNVELADGDVLLLTADPAEELGSLAVTHADGSVTEYEAEVYSDGEDPEGKVITVLSPLTETYIDEINEDGFPRTLAYLMMDRVALEENIAENYPGLAAAIDEVNAAERELADAFMEQLAEEAHEDYAADGENFISPEVVVKAFFRRADNRVFSILFEHSLVHRGHTDWDYRAYNIDALTGEKLTLSGIVNDISLLPTLINDQMDGRYEDGFMLDEEEDYSSYFSEWSCKDFAWTLDPGGIHFIFNAEAFGIDEAYLDAALVPYGEDQELVSEDLSACPENYAIGLPWGLTTYVMAGGRVSPVCVGAPESEDGWLYDRMTVSFDRDMLTDEVEAFTFEPLFIHCNDSDYLYVETSGMDDYNEILCYRLADRCVTKCGSLAAGWHNYCIEDEAGDDYHYYTCMPTDPELFVLTSRTDVLSTVDGSKLYTIGEDGVPETGNEWFYLEDQLMFTLLRDLEVTTTDENGEPNGTEVLRKGESMYYVATDNESVAVLAQADMPVYIVYVEYVEGVGPAIDGVAIDEIFDGIMFAG